MAFTRAGDAIDCGGGGKYEVSYAVSHATLNEITGLARVIPIVEQWVLDRLRYDRQRGEVQDGVDLPGFQNIVDQITIADVAFDEVSEQYRLAKSLTEVIQCRQIVSG